MVAVLGLITEASFVERGVQSAWASVVVVHGLGNCDSQALNADSVVMAHRLCCSMACEVFPARDQTGVPCIGSQTLNHWTTREAPSPFFKLFFVLDIELYELFIYFGDYVLLLTSFASIFYHSVGCLFVLLMVFFAVKKLLCLIRTCLFLFVFLLL